MQIPRFVRYFINVKKFYNSLYPKQTFVANSPPMAYLSEKKVPLTCFFLLLLSEKRSAEIRKYHGSSVFVGNLAGRMSPTSGCLFNCIKRVGERKWGGSSAFAGVLGNKVRDFI